MGFISRPSRDASPVPFEQHRLSVEILEPIRLGAAAPGAEFISFGPFPTTIPFDPRAPVPIT
jgi:hypothetical protein